MGGGPGASKYGVVSHSMCAAAFLALTLFSLWRIMEPLAKVQNHDLRFRVYWCVKCAIYVCVMSFWVSVLHVTNFETIVWAEMGMSTDNIIKPLEYIITCPAMMLIIVVLAGDKVPARRQMEVMGLTTCVLVVGFAAVQTPALPAKMMFYGTGVTFFITLMHRVNACVLQHSDGKEGLFSGGPMSGSIYRKLCFKTASTWVLFPVWFLISPEGLGVIQNKDAAILITAVLNIFSKAFFILYVVHIYEDFVSEESLMNHSHKCSSHEEQQAAEAAARLGPAQAIKAMESNIRSSQECISKIQNLMDKDYARMAAMEARRTIQSGLPPAFSGHTTPGGMEYTGYANTMGGFPQQGGMEQIGSAPATHRSHMGAMTPQGSFSAGGAPPMLMNAAMAPPPYTKQPQALHGAAPPSALMPPPMGAPLQQAYPGADESGMMGMATGMGTLPEHSTMLSPQPPATPHMQPYAQEYPQPFAQPFQAPMVPMIDPSLATPPVDTVGSHVGHHTLQKTADHCSSVPMMLGAAMTLDDKAGDADFPTFPEGAPVAATPVSMCGPVSGGLLGVQGKAGGESGSIWATLRGRRGAALEADAAKQSAEVQLDP